MEDQAIIALFFARDPDAIEAVSTKYGPYCRSIACNILDNSRDAEECLNDTWLQLWNSIPPNQPANLAAYAGKIIRNLAFNRTRENRAQKRGGSNVTLLLSELTDLVSGDPSPEEATQSRELYAAINAFLAQLPQWKRYIFVRRYWYADSIIEIAHAVHRTEGHISATLTRLRRKLHRYLTERGFDL